MFFFPPFASAAAKPDNPALDYETLGLNSGNGITITSGGSTNTLGSYVTIGTTGSAWSLLEIEVASAAGSNTAARWQLYLRLGGTVVVPAFPFSVTSGRGSVGFRIAVPANTLVEIAGRSSAASNTIKVIVIGTKDSSTTSPGYTITDELVGASGTSTYAGTVDVPVNNTYTTLVASTAQAYGAIQPAISASTTLPSVAQSGVVILAVGAAGSEVDLPYYNLFGTGTSNPGVTFGGFRMIEKAIPSGSRISARIIAPNLASGDNLRVGAWGYR